ncbi:MAG TPA: TRAM domain-containing protein [Candidatus Saccharimonadales bacterium]|nr:TRAM domain-containing protein [Candidatus Saccharimonadales bacterium]
MEEVVIEKLVHGGQGLGTLEDGRKIFVWGALPGEKVGVRIIKRKKSYVEAVVTDVVEPSPLRIRPREENYLATSPWQIVPLAAENDYKQSIVKELFTQAHVALPEFSIAAAGPEWNYRNKMEYSFWGDEDGLHLALHMRGSHTKQVVKGSALAMPALDAAANDILGQLRDMQVRAGDLKTVIVRCSQNGEAAAALFVKPKTFANTNLHATSNIKGIRVYHSNPKSPAAVPTKLLAEIGDCTLADTLLGHTFTYDIDSFFQVNIPIFETALNNIKNHGSTDNLTDMYAGVGSIGLSVAKKQVMLVEIDSATAAMARINAANASVQAEVIEAPSEKALAYIVPGKTVIFDPPRAGLHNDVIKQVLQILPPKILYLSCNPATQARDLSLIAQNYKITYFTGYNFFPHTPHIETLAVLERI